MIMPTSIIKKIEYENYVSKEKLPLLRLDSTYLLNLKVYNSIIQRAEKNGIDVCRIEEIGKLRKGQERKDGRKAYGIMVKSIAKLTIHPLKLELKFVSESSLVKPCDIAIISTGIGSIGRSGIVPRFFVYELTKEFFNESLPVAVTQHIIKFEPNRRDISPYYIITLLNSFYGRLLIEGIATYGATGQLEVHTPTLSKLKVPLLDIHNKISETIRSAIEDYEAKAWKAYFKAMKMVEEYLKPTLIKTTGVSRLLKAKNTRRLDSAGLLAFDLLEEIAKRFGKSIKLYNVFEIKSGNVPRSKDYKGVSGIPYITIDSIDDSGIIDEEKMAFIPEERYKRLFTKTRNYDILLVKDGIGSLGKVAVTLGEYPVMSGIFILRGKAIEDELLYYIITILKTRFYRKIMEMMSYGTTGQISLMKRDVENLLIPILDNYKEIGVLFKEFVENIYQANALKRQAIAELENYILRLVS